MIEAYLVNYVTIEDYEMMMESAAPDFYGSSPAEFAQPVGSLHIGDLGSAIQQIIETLIADDFRDNERAPGGELELTAEREGNDEFITYSLSTEGGVVYAVVSARKYELNLTI